MFLFNLYPRHLPSWAKILVPLMVNAVSLPGEADEAQSGCEQERCRAWESRPGSDTACVRHAGPDPAALPGQLRGAYQDLKNAHIKTLSFLVYLARSPCNALVRPYQVSLLAHRLRPPGSPAERLEPRYTGDLARRSPSRQPSRAACRPARTRSPCGGSYWWPSGTRSPRTSKGGQRIRAPSSLPAYYRLARKARAACVQVLLHQAGPADGRGGAGGVGAAVPRRAAATSVQHAGGAHPPRAPRAHRSAALQSRLHLLQVRAG